MVVCISSEGGEQCLDFGCCKGRIDWFFWYNGYEV